MIKWDWKLHIHLKEGKLKKAIKITLISIPPAGYSWQAEYDVSFLDLKSHTFKTIKPGVIGGKSKETFLFLPRKVGETEVILRYKRPWEKETLKEEHYRLTIRE
jgi:predicted secreted protein